MPRNIEHINNRPTDTAGDTAVMFDALYHPDTLPLTTESETSISTATIVDTISTTQRPTAGDAHRLTASPLNSMGAMAFIVIAAFFTLTSYRSGYKYIENLANYLFSVKRRDSLFDDHTVSETRIMLAMLFNTWVMEGFLLYYLIGISEPSLLPLLQQSVTLHISIFIACAALFHIVQSMIYRLIGWVFSDAISTKLWLSGFNSSQAILGIALFAVVVFTLINPDNAKIMLFIAFALYILARIVFVCKGFRIFFNNFNDCLFFILYLCSVEIVPPLSFYAGIVALCNVI